MKNALCLKKLHSRWLSPGTEYPLVAEGPTYIQIAINGTLKNYPKNGFVIKEYADIPAVPEICPKKTIPLTEQDQIVQINSAISERLEALHIAMISRDREEIDGIMSDIKVYTELKKELTC